MEVNPSLIQLKNTYLYINISNFIYFITINNNYILSFIYYLCFFLQFIDNKIIYNLFNIFVF